MYKRVSSSTSGLVPRLEIADSTKHTENPSAQVPSTSSSLSTHRTSPLFLTRLICSGQFCGMARMMSPVDYNKSSSVWTQVDKWKGRMEVRWIFVKDIPNPQLRHIRVWNNENKPVTNSRDTQELPPDAGVAMLRIFSDYPPTKSVILTNLAMAEMKEEAATAEDRHTSLQSVDELGGQYTMRQSLPVQATEEYIRPVHAAEPMYPRQSWQSSSGDDVRSVGRQSYQFDVQDYSSRDSRGSQNSSLNRRNTISSIGPIGSSTRSTPISTTPTSGMRGTPDTAFVPTQSRLPESSTSTSSYRSVFAGLGDIYASSRYPPFTSHDKTVGGGHVRYDHEELRYF